MIIPAPSDVGCTCPNQPRRVHREGCPVIPTLLAELPPDLINEPPHYKDHPSGVECITITEGFNFNKGNAIKYIWRAGKKGDAVPDLEKARFYIDREIKRIEAEWKNR